jgi:hypothetical protein
MNGCLRTKLLRPLAACALAGSIVLPPVARADEARDPSPRCPDAVVSLALKAVHAAPKGEVRDSACQSLAGTGHTLVAVAYEPKGYESERAQGLPVHVAILDDQARRIVAYGQTRIVEDTSTDVHARSLNWDATPLELAHAVTGYELRIDAFRASRERDGGEGPTLTLFAVTGRDMRPVVSDLKLETWRCEDGPCTSDEAAQTTTTVDLSLAESRTHGMRDLLLTTRHTGSEKPHAWVARFDGSAYDLRGWAQDEGE